MSIESQEGSELFSEESTERSLRDLYPVVRRVARTYSRDPDHADDLTQECMIRIAHNLAKCDSRLSLTAWARTVAHNHCRTLYRRGRHVESRRVSLDDCEEIRDPRCLPDRHWEVRCHRTTVHAAIDQLPEREGTAIRHVYLEGLTYREAAARMDVRANSARRAVTRGMAKLRHAVDLVVWTEPGLRSSACGAVPCDGDHPVLALEPSRIARDRLLDGLHLGATDRLLDGVHFASRWREIDDLARSFPGCPVVVDPECPGHGRRGIDALRRLRAHNPDCPVIGYGRARRSWQNDGCLAREIGFFAVVSMGVDDHPGALRDVVLRAADCRETDILVRRVQKRSAPEMHRFLDLALHESVTHWTLACVAHKLGVGQRKLAEQCRAFGLPAPKRLMLLACVFHIERLARWSGHAHGSVALAVGFRRPSDYRRMVQRLLGVTPAELAARGGPDHLADVIVHEVDGGSDLVTGRHTPHGHTPCVPGGG
jgi:RNA polymerase sigma-70 factor (ECF subfamily)